MKRLILNADDFGASEATNAAILRAHIEGVLTTASLMVNELAANSAITLARETPSLRVGLHVAVSDGFSALGATNVPALVDSTGRFRSDPALAGITYFFRPSARKQIAREVEAQFDRFATSGLTLDHVNGHQHLHVHPVVWDAVLPLSAALGCNSIRIPFEEFVPYSAGRLAMRRVEWLFFRALRRRCLRTMRSAGFRTPDRVYGHLETGAITEEYLLGLLERIAGDTAEVYFHPGTPHVKGRAGEIDVELAALMSTRVRDKISASNWQLSSYQTALWAD